MSVREIDVEEFETPVKEVATDETCPGEFMGRILLLFALLRRGGERDEVFADGGFEAVERDEVLGERARGVYGAEVGGDEAWEIVRRKITCISGRYQCFYARLIPARAAASAMRFCKAGSLPRMVTMTASWPWRTGTSSSTGNSSDTLTCLGYVVLDLEDLRLSTVMSKSFFWRAAYMDGPRLPSAPRSTTDLMDMAGEAEIEGGRAQECDYLLLRSALNGSPMAIAIPVFSFAILQLGSS